MDFLHVNSCNTCLISDVVKLTIEKSTVNTHKCGAWVRLALKGLEDEFHPFNLTSAPHEEFLTVHVRAVGPWTRELQHVYLSAEVLHDYPPVCYSHSLFTLGTP